MPEGLGPDLSGEQFLHQKNPSLHLSKPVEHQVERQRIADEPVSSKPANKIAEWLKVIEHTHTEHRDDPRVVERLKKYYHDNFVIKPEDIPESTFLLEQRIARNEGHGTIEITDEFRERKTQQIITDQETSLDKWFDYLTSPDADYPMWAKYWAFTSILSMGAFVKEEQGEGDEKKESAHFTTRDKKKNTTTASFPPLNPRALAMTIGVMRAKLEQGQKPKNERQPVVNTSTRLDDPSFQQLLSTENFSKLYAQFLIEMPEYSTQGLRETRGKWVKYKKGSDPKPLVDSLDGYPLEWCTANIDTARSQLKSGDFYVYYSINEQGEAVIPRLAIRMQGNNIAENPRGIAPNQNLDPYIGEVLEQKLNNSDEFPNRAEFEKKSADMKKLTEIEKKTNKNEELSPEDLRFLYEIDSTIEGFGYERDPRIEEIRSKRNPREDAPIALYCQPEEIAWEQDQITKDTKAYIGPLFLGIFDLPNLEHIYTSLSEREIKRSKFVTCGKNGSDLLADLKARGINVVPSAEEILQGPEFVTCDANETIPTVRLKVSDLFSDGQTHTYIEIITRARELGLTDDLPHETASNLLLNESTQPNLYPWYFVASKTFASRNDRSIIFGLEHNGIGLFLSENWTLPGDKWKPVIGLKFGLRTKPEQSSV